MILARIFLLGMYQGEGGRLFLAMTYTEKARHLFAQSRYEREIEARGIMALLAPYRATVKIPAQRTEPGPIRP